MADARLNVLITATNEAKAAIDGAIRQLAGLSASLSALGGSAARDAARGMDELNKATKEGADANKDFSKSAKESTSALDKLLGGVKALASGYLGLKSIQLVKNIADTAARSEVLGTVLKRVALNAGISARQIDEVDKKVQSLGITAISSRQSLAQFIQAGLDLKRAPELARAAQDLAVVAGRDSSETFQRLIVNIQQMDTVGLKFMGLIVDRNQAEKDFAKELGKTTQELTKQEKQQAFLNATLTESSKLAGLYTEAMTNVGKQLTSLPRLIITLKDSLGQQLLPAYSALVRQFTIFLENSNLLAGAFAQNRTAAEAFGATVERVATAVREFVESLIINFDKVKVAFQFVAAVKFANLITDLRLVTFSFGEMASAIATMPGLFGKAALSAGLLVKSLGAVAGAFAIGYALGDFFNSFDAVKSFAATVVSFIVSRIEIGIGTFRKLFIEIERRFDVFLATVTLKGDKAIAAINKQAAAETAAIDQRISAVILAADKVGDLTVDDSGFKQVQKDLLEANTQLLLLKQRNGEAAKAGRKEDVASLTVEVDKQKALVAQLNARLRSFTASKSISEEEVKALVVENERVAAINAAKKAYDESTKAVQTALEGLIEKKLSITEGGQFFSKESEKQVKNFDKVLNAVLGKTSVDIERLDINFQTLRQSLRVLVDSAKTADDFTEALKRLSASSELATTYVRELSRTAIFRRQQVEAKELDDILKGYSERIKMLQGLQDTVFQVAKTLGDKQLEFAQAQAELAGNTQKQSELQIQKVNQETTAIRTKYQQSLAVTAETERRRIEQIRESGQNQETVERRITDVTRDANRERLKISADYFKELATQSTNALNNYKSYQRQVIALDQEIDNVRRGNAQTVRALERSLLNDQQQFQDRQAEIQETAALAEEALQNKNYDLAKKLNDRRKQLATELASAQGIDKKVATKTAIDAINAADEQRVGILEEQKTEAQDAADAQLTQYQQLQQELGNLAQSIQSLASQEAIKLKFDIDTTSLTNVVQQVANSFPPIRLTFDTSAFPKQLTGDTGGTVSPTPTFASGGKVRGRRTPVDSILARVTGGEWVQPIAAVRHYGENFMQAVNDLSFPRFASGGLVEASNRNMKTGFGGAGVTVAPWMAPEKGTTPTGLISANKPFESMRNPVVLDFGEMLGTVNLQGSDKSVETLKRIIAQAATKRRRS